jgi:energy-converting hydrogenase Eha subunit C
MAAIIIMISLVLITFIVWLASRGKIDAVRAAIYTGAIGQIGTLATALVSGLGK